MTDSELQDHCDVIMLVEVLSKIGDDFTPEQMAIFNEVIKLNR
jgi:hypothetical protein